jgi:hypothetical protein
MKWISFIDFLGTKPTLNIRGKTGYQTLFGGLLSIVVFCLLMAGAGYFINQLLSKTNFTIIQSEEYSPLGFMDWTNNEFAVTLVDRIGQQIPEADRIYSISAFWFHYEEVKTSSGSIMNTKMKFFDMEYCDLNKHFSNSTNLWKDEKFLSTSYCLPKDVPLNTSQVYGSTGNKGITLWLTRCLNTTTKKNCFSPERVEKELENVIVMTRFKNYYFDHKVDGDTGIPYIYTHTPSVSSTVYIRFWYDMQNIEYVTDDSLFLSSSNVRQYNTLGDLKQTTDLTKDTVIPGTFATLLINMHSMKKNVKKNYYKFQNMLADLGGLMKGILTVAGVINMYFSDKLYFNFIINQNLNSLVELKSNQQEKNQDNKSKFFEKSTLNNNHPSEFILKDDISKNENSEFHNNNYLSYNNAMKNLNNQEDKTKQSNSVNQSKNIVPIKIKVTPLPKNLLSKNYMNQIKFGYDELIFPAWCLSKKSKARKNLNFHNKLCELINNKFDMSNLFNKLCNVDKLEYIMCGEEINFINTMFNPTFYKDGKIPLESDEVLLRDKILKNLLKSS